MVSVANGARSRYSLVLFSTKDTEYPKGESHFEGCSRNSKPPALISPPGDRNTLNIKGALEGGLILVLITGMVFS